ncbi:MAG: class I SAM-dependent methyltransferase [Chloroflexi bacterium]|nr:class I SAM-dependent methyltransferase [Chloroflexota bacterium]
MAEWGTREWFERMCDPSCADTTGDGWGHRWRGLQQFRYARYLKLLKPLVVRSDRQLDILDIGCAFGDFTEKVYALNPQNRICGVDISENAIKVVSERLPQLRFRVNALPALDFPAGSFDLVLCLEVLYYLDSAGRERGLDSIKRALRPGGCLVISGPLDGGKRYFKRDGILKLVAEKGFLVEKTQYSYNQMYASLERRLLATLNMVSHAEKLTNMSDKQYAAWLEGRKPGRRPSVINLARRLPGRNITNGMLSVSERLLRAAISNGASPAFSQELTRALVWGRKPSSIAIVARII